MLLMWLYLTLSSVGIYSKKDIFVDNEGNFYRIVSYKEPNLIWWRPMKKFLCWYRDDNKKEDFLLDYMEGEFLSLKYKEKK